MSNKFNLEINDFGRINKANIEINKINVIGGTNASGKTTASKLLYCFLKSQTTTKSDVISDLLNEVRLSKPQDTVNGNFLNEYDMYKNFYLVIQDFLMDYEKGLFDEYYYQTRFEELIKDHVKAIEDDLNKLEDDTSLKTLLEEYERKKQLIEIIIDCSDKPDDEWEGFYSKIKIFNPIIEELKKDNSNNNILCSYTLSSLISKESLTVFNNSLELKGNKNKYVKFYNNSLKSIIHYDYEKEYDFRKSGLYLTKGSLKNIPNVFYIGTISIFDLDKYYTLLKEKTKTKFKYEEHIEDLIKNIENINDHKNLKKYFPKNERNKVKNYNKKELYGRLKHVLLDYDIKIHNTESDEEKNELLIIKEEIEEILKRSENENKNKNLIEGKIRDIIQGQFRNSPPMKFSYSSEERHFTDTINTSSGIKQIGVVELLLKNNKLIPGTFLIIDEPEVNLHPEWQFKFAEILVLLAKELDITIYLNTHSPAFIESIDAFTEYYNMETDVNYYLTEKSTHKNTYNFNKVESDELYKIYNNLGNVYKLTDKLRIKKRMMG